MRKHQTKYTDEQRAQRDATDAAIRHSALELLGDPDAVAAMVSHLATTTSPKLLRYSVHNVAMLTRQAQERGMALSDVDSFQGWSQRGRGVRKGERGLRIVAPKGLQTTVDTEPNTAIATESEQAERGEIRVLFRTVTVFDISQTEGAEDNEAEAVADPDSVLRDSLTTQIKRLGYTLTTVYHATAIKINKEAGTVTLPPNASVTELGLALADLTTRPRTHRPTDHPATVNTRAA